MIILITGIIAGINSVDIDKSGKHPKYTYFIQLKVESTQGSSSDIPLGSVITVQAKEKDLISQLGRNPEVGDRVTVSSDLYDQHARVVHLGKITFDASKD